MNHVIVHFTRGRGADAGKFRVVCVPGARPTVEVEVTDTDALSTQTKRWAPARGFDLVATAEILRDALLRALLGVDGEQRSDGVIVRLGDR